MQQDPTQAVAESDKSLGSDLGGLVGRLLRPQRALFVWETRLCEFTDCDHETDLTVSDSEDAFPTHGGPLVLPRRGLCYD